MDEAILSLSTRFDFLGVSVDISSSDSVSKSSQSSIFERVSDFLGVLGVPDREPDATELVFNDIQS
jgi:uncharacterized tellurite resistance protein B-like protein